MSDDTSFGKSAKWTRTFGIRVAYAEVHRSQ